VAVLGERGPPVERLAFSPDGGLLLTCAEGGESRQLRLWETTTGKERRHWEERGGSVLCLAFSPDGRHFVSGGEVFPLQIREVETGREVARLEGAGDVVFDAAFAPDGLSLITGDRDHHAGPGSVRWWDARTGEQRRCLRGHAYYASSVAFFPDGRRALSGNHGNEPTLRVWDLEAGREIRRFTGLAPGVGRVAVSPDGRRVATGLGRGVAVWELDRPDNTPWRELGGHTDTVGLILFGPDGRTLTSVADDYRILCHDLESGKTLLHRKLAGNAHGKAAAADRRHLAIANPDGTIFLFRLAPAAGR
jgi:WD40 repeat protein